MEIKGELAEYTRSGNQGEVQCIDCGNFYKNRNTLNSHRSVYCPKRNSTKMRKLTGSQDVLRTPVQGGLRSVVKVEPEIVREDIFNDDDVAYWKEFEQFK